MINLRGHHMFCSSLFVGNGYSEEFCVNMEKIIIRMKSEKIKIVQCQDDVCSSCPHANLDGTCKNGNDNVSLRDKNALAVVGVNKNQIYSYDEIHEKLKLIDEKSFNKVCHHCQWGVSGLCSYDKFKKMV